MNGGNVLLREPDGWHFWFTDVRQLPRHSVVHAAGAAPGAVTFQGVALSRGSS